MRRIAALAIIGWLVSACGSSGSSVFDSLTTAPAVTTSPTGSPETSTSGPETTTEPASSTTAIAADLGRLAVWQILQRWDGDREMGSFEATVCNLGQAPAPGLEAVLSANGIEVRIALPEVPARGCVDAYDPTSTFETFAARLGDTVAVRAAVIRDGTEVDALEAAVTVDLLSPEPTPEVLEAYNWCLEHETEHGYCVPLAARTAFDDPHEVMKQGGRFVVVVPAAYEPLAAVTLADMAICIPNLEAYLGIPMSPHTTPLVWRFAESRDEFWFGAGAGIIHLEPASAHFFERALNGEYFQHSWETVFQGFCSEAHETTHIMMDELKGLPNWLNEGLAVHMSNRRRTNWYWTDPSFRCSDSGYYDINSFTGEETFVPYAALEPEPVPEGVPFGNYYVTGACFWEFFEETYGHEAFLQVMDILAGTRELPGGPWQGCPTFLELVTPVIGEDISALTRERFGFGSAYASCYIGG